MCNEYKCVYEASIIDPIKEAELKEERERKKKQAHIYCPPPLMEGHVPMIAVMTAEGKIEYREPKPAEEWKDQVFEHMTILVEEEYYDHVTRCNHCGTDFIAYADMKLIRNYCPGCGQKL